MAAHATTDLKLGTGVTNSFTRHPAVTASAIATIQAEIDGRAYFGIGRGDSAWRTWGSRRTRYRHSKRTSNRCKTTCAGTKSSLASVTPTRARSARRTRAHARCQPDPLDRCPLSEDTGRCRGRVAACDRRCRAACRSGQPHRRHRPRADQVGHGRRGSPSQPLVSIRRSPSPYIPTVVHDDPETALSIGSPSLSLFARFSNMYSEIVGPATKTQRQVLTQIHNRYDMRQHAQADKCAVGTGDPRNSPAASASLARPATASSSWAS